MNFSKFYHAFLYVMSLHNLHNLHKIDKENISNMSNLSISTITKIEGKGIVCNGFSPSICDTCKKHVCKGCSKKCITCGNHTVPVTSNQYFIASYSKNGR